MARLEGRALRWHRPRRYGLVTPHIAEVYPKSTQGWSATVTAANDFLKPRTRGPRSLWMLLGAVGFVLFDCVRRTLRQPLLARGTVPKRGRGSSIAGCDARQLFSQFLRRLALGGDWRRARRRLAWALLQDHRGLDAAPFILLPSGGGRTAPRAGLLFTLGVDDFRAGVLFGLRALRFKRRV